MNHPKHIPVLLPEVLSLLKPQKGDSYLDLTAGYGGHAKAIRKLLGESGSLTLVDRDKQAIEALTEAFTEDHNAKIMHNDFLTASKQLNAANEKYDVILADLGVSSQHLNKANRGFSFSKAGPLDMRMDQSQGLSAEEVANEYDEDQLNKILREYGEIRKSRDLAQHILKGRPYKDTLELSKQVARFFKIKGRKDPSTQTFQAFRIEVNSELTQLEQSLPIWLELLKPGGRLGVISFHSLEDRIVKQFFKDYGGKRYDARLHIITKKPVMGSDKEVVFNPRARSAKLRVAQRK